MRHSDVWRAADQEKTPQWLPANVRNLAPREREVAVIVYACGAQTADEVRAQLSKPISNGAVRSMLVRLVHKGILSRRPFGTYRAYTYFPVITNDHMREKALLQLTEEFFGGSLESAAHTIAGLIEKQTGGAAAVLPFQLTH